MKLKPQFRECSNTNPTRGAPSKDGTVEKVNDAYALTNILRGRHVCSVCACVFWGFLS